jgi:AcrR family transcriptional regulator
MLDEHLIAEAAVPGLRPTQQQRSRELVVRLMNEGLALLRDHDFDSLSIEALCARCEATVGSFYGRFESKEAFIDTLQRLVVADARRYLDATYASGRVPDDSLPHLLGWICKGGVRWYRDHEGLVRACLRRATHDRRTWTSLREVGRLHVTHALPRIVALSSPEPGTALQERIAFAFQMLYGTLNNMVLIDPGPVSLRQASAAGTLAAAMQQLIVRRT